MTQFNPAVQATPSTVKLSIIVPCRNERRHIRAFLDNLRELQIPAGTDHEILIADGGSDDGTRELLEIERETLPKLTILDNPEQAVAPGLNLAIRQSQSDVIVRLDVHTRYAPDYLVECIRALKESNAENVGGPWIARGVCPKSRAIALAFQPAFVSGGGKAHDPLYEGWVDTVYLGCWRRHTLMRLGCFDESMIRAQDSELNLRIIRSGGRIWQTPRIRSFYEPRSSYRHLFWQYMQYGYWKAVTLDRHRKPASLRQLIPPIFVASFILLAASAPWFMSAKIGLLGIVCGYLATAAFFAAKLTNPLQDRSPVHLILLAFPTYHFGFGYGYLRGLFDQFLVRRRHPAAALVRLTRPTANSQPR